MSSAEQIEQAFTQLPTQIQLALLDRLAKCVRTRRAAADTAFAAEVAAMAADPEIIREIREIDAEFRVTENDGLRPA